MQEEKLEQAITATQKIARMLLKTIAGLAVVAASIYVYLDAFGIVEAPEKVKEIAKGDSVLIQERSIDSLSVDTNAIN